MEIEIGEYVRTRQGYIAKLIETDEEDEEYMQFDGPIRIDWGDEVDYISSKEDVQKITKHFKDIIDLIEVGDILELQEYIDMFKETEKIGVSDIEMLNTIKEGIKENKVRLISILTHEQYKDNSYKVVK